MANAIRRGRKRTTIGVIALLSIGGAGVAFAYWTSIGIGEGTATTGDSVAFEITSEAAIGTIAPGNAGQTVDFTVTNPGEGTQSLGGVTVTLADPAGAPWVPAGTCSAADYTATISTPPVYGEIAPGGALEGTATVTLTNTALNQDDCQGQTVPLYFEAE
jgi:hypothetical protein